MAANPLTIEELIARAVQAGEIVEGVNDTKTLTKRVDELTKLLVELNALLGPERRKLIQSEPSPEVVLVEKALRIAGSPEKLGQWMRTPVPALNDQTPFSLMQTKEGRKQVEDVLGRIEHGVY